MFSRNNTTEGKLRKVKKKIGIFAATFALALTATFSFSSSPVAAGSCQTQCRVGYDKCVKQTKNPGGLNQCRRAYDNCLSRCS
jgi:hypothetical protein